VTETDFFNRLSRGNIIGFEDSRIQGFEGSRGNAKKLASEEPCGRDRRASII